MKLSLTLMDENGEDVSLSIRVCETFSVNS